MSNVKRTKKHEVVEPSEDSSCSCEPTQTSSSDCTPHHENKYEEKCNVTKHEGKRRGTRCCKTVCYVKCSQPVTYEYNWSYKTASYKEEKCDEPIPKDCNSKPHPTPQPKPHHGDRK